MTTEKAIDALEEMLGIEKRLLPDSPLPASTRRIEALQFAIDKLRGSQITEPFFRGGWQGRADKIKSLNLDGHEFEVMKEVFTNLIFVYSHEIKKYLLRNGLLNDHATIEEDGETLIVGWFKDLNEVNAAVEKYHAY